MSGIRVAVNPLGKNEVRCAFALAGHPSVAEVGLIDRDPPASWQERIRRVDSASGFDVIVSGRYQEALAVFGIETEGSGPCVTGASVAGLARTLLSRVDDGVALVAIPGKPGRDGMVVRLPKPIGDLRISGDYRGVPMGRCAAPWAAAAAVSTTRTVAVIDDHRFMAAAALAAGVLLGSDGAVWEHPGDYLAACQEFGLVVAEAAQPG